MVERRGPQRDEHLARAGDRVRRRPRTGAPPVPPSSWMRIAFTWHNPVMTAAELAPAAARSSASTRSARPPPRPTRRPSGTSASARRAASSRGWASRPRRPEVSCHPESLLPGARTVDLGGALLLRRRAGAAARARDGSPRYTWSDRYAELREKLDALGRRLGGEYRVLVDANDHVDREGAVRAGVGFYGKNTLAITRRHGSWVVLGTLVTDREPSSRRRLWTPAAAPARSASTPARPARSTSRACSTRRAASRTGRRRPTPIPEPYRAAARRARLRLRHLPGRLPLEPRRREAARRRAAAGRSRAGRLARRVARRRTGRSSSSATTASTCLATIRAGCAGTRSWLRGTSAAPHERAAVAPYADERRSAAARARRVGARAPRRAGCRDDADPDARVRAASRSCRWRSSRS